MALLRLVRDGDGRGSKRWPSTPRTESAGWNATGWPPAFGQQPAPPDWLAALGVEIDAEGRIRCGAEGRTTNPCIYAGGDASQGPDLVVTALAAGRRAAAAILADQPPLASLRRAARPVSRLLAEEALA